MMNNVMNFIGDGELRVIVTHDDVAREQTGCNPAGTTTQLSETLDFSAKNMIVVGKETEVKTLEAFIKSALHTPKEFKISEVQCGCQEVHAKIAAASRASEDLTKNGKSHQAQMS
jgi:hypothetical protein